MATLLLTATQHVSEALAQKLKPLGHGVILFPLLEIAEVEWQRPATAPKNILITSRYALKAAESYKGAALYIVGHKTAELAKAAGHKIERIGFTINNLYRHIPEDTLYLRGRDISQDLPFPNIICYEAKPATLPETIPQHDAAILLSARAAQHLPTTKTSIICLSPQVKAGLNEANQAQAVVAAEPTEYELIETIKHWNGNE